MLAVSNVEVVYNDVILVLRGISLEVPDGFRIVIPVPAWSPAMGNIPIRIYKTELKNLLLCKNIKKGSPKKK